MIPFVPLLLYWYTTGAQAEAKSFDSTDSNDALPPSNPLTLPWWHPSIERVARNRIPGPSNHPAIDSVVFPFIFAHTDEDHEFSFDGWDGWVQRPGRYPGDHPNLDAYFPVAQAPSGLAVPAFAWHPDPQDSYVRGVAPPDGHPSVQEMLLPFLPPAHPNVDELLTQSSGNQLPDWHPPLTDFIDRSGGGGIGSLDDFCAVPVFRGHPDVGEAYARGEAVPANHPPVGSYFAECIPEGHPNIDELLRSPEAAPLPEWHPPLGSMVKPRTIWSPGLSFVLAVSAVLGVAILVRVLKHVSRCAKDARATSSSPSTPSNGARPTRTPGPGPVPAGFEHDLEHLPRRRLTNHEMEVRTAGHRSDHPAYTYEAVSPDVPRTRTVGASARGKSASAKHFLRERIMGTRIPKTQWTSGNLILCLAYVLLNVLAIVVRNGDYGVDRGLGSLAAANTVFLVMAATRNSLLTWFLGLPFDRVVLYHRFLGRVTITVAFLHFLWYSRRLVAHASERTYWTGLAALGCGLGIVATTTNWVRRNRFNVFFWSHYLFVGFFAFAYLHARQGRPFLLTAIGLYVLDKTLRALWTWLPRRTTAFRNIGDTTAHVQFQKNELVRLMGRHRVGQYMFVNFPELSLTEWHPFSVSSGPNEDVVELHIRALGDHTKKIVALSKSRASEGRQAWIRADGPYGYLGFDYRRYGVLLLVGGGIGVTPVMSLLKDIYGVSRSGAPHCIQRVYAVWVMPQASEASLFLDDLNGFRSIAAIDPTLPDLTITVHCTRARAGENLAPPMVAGRPDFSSIMEACEMEYARSPLLVFVCGPGMMVNQLWDESRKRNKRNMRIDFHHETFEF